MFKITSSKQVFLDVETAPDYSVIRRVYNLSDKTSDDVSLDIAYQRHGASTENPKPFLKPMFHRIVSACLLSRDVKLNSGAKTVDDSYVSLHFHTLPETKDGQVQECYERDIIKRVMTFIGRNKPQVVGWNSVGFDMPLLFQRAVINGVEIPDYCKRPAKPWEGVDYFAKYSDWNVDLMSTLAGHSYGQNPRLGEFAAACGIPGKIAGIDGSQVAEAYKDGKLAEIVSYNEFDVCTTYLIWLRMAWIGGFVSAKAYAEEQETFRLLLEKRIKEGATHFQKYLNEWAFF